MGYAPYFTEHCAKIGSGYSDFPYDYGKMTTHNQRSLNRYKTEALKICKDFHYDQSVRDRIRAAKTEIQIERIMRTAAKGL